MSSMPFCRRVSLFLLLLVSGVIPGFLSSVMMQQAARPNIILVLVDDMGWSDPSCYGGEIETPNLDRLAAEGLRSSQFYNCAKCETTRATLLSGRYRAEVGVAKLQCCATLAEVLAGAGYQTWMAGKWHLSGNPLDRGFGRYFGHLSGATNFFTGDGTFRIDCEVFKVPERGVYTTDANTDYAIQFIRDRDRERPFFLYFAHNAPHYRPKAHKEEVMKYRGTYKEAWDRLRAQRLDRIRNMGLQPKTAELSTRSEDVSDWHKLSEKERDQHDLVMATYAAMIDRVDTNMGRLVQCLQDEKEFERTLILFLSDNGACPFQRTTPQTLEGPLMPWDPKSHWTYDQRWTHACNTPFRAYKRNQHEGGIRTPMIAHWPQGLANPGTITHQPGHILDMMATCIELGAARDPVEANNPIEGQSQRAKRLIEQWEAWARTVKIKRKLEDFRFSGCCLNADLRRE